MAEGDPTKLSYIRWNLQVVDAYRILRYRQFEELKRRRDEVNDRIFKARCAGAEDTKEMEQLRDDLDYRIEYRILEDEKEEMTPQEKDQDLLRRFAEMGIKVRFTPHAGKSE